MRVSRSPLELTNQERKSGTVSITSGRETVVGFIICLLCVFVGFGSAWGIEKDFKKGGNYV